MTSFEFGVIAVERGFDRDQGAETKVVLRQAGTPPKERTVYFGGWHPADRLARLIQHRLDAMAEELTLQAAETALLGTTFTVSAAEQRAEGSG